MLYWQFWNSFWKQWETLEAKHPASDPAPSLPVQSADTDYLSRFGTQILCLIDTDQACVQLSPNFTAITGHACGASLDDRFFQLAQPDARDKLKALATGDSMQQWRCKLQHADAQWYWYLFTFHPRQGANGECVCILENIHESMQTQNRLQKARLEAELALRARSEFLSNMSHELRTPLNAVIGFSQIIESEMFGKIDNPQYKDYVRHIQESGHDLLSKIEDLLEIANLDAGRVTLSRETVSAADILRHVRDAQAHHALSVRVTLESVPPQQELLLYVDRLKIQHILGHLVANAIRFSHEGGRVTLTASQSAQGQVQLCIHDNGVGITQAKLNDITSGLQEEHCWTAGNNRSIGLGLALSREFVALHGGQLQLRSHPGQGTTVQITLPSDCARANAVAKPTATIEYVQQAAH